MISESCGMGSLRAELSLAAGERTGVSMHAGWTRHRQAAVLEDR